MSTVLTEEPVAAERAGGPLRRVLSAAGVGVVAGTGLQLLTTLLLESPSCRDASGYGCLGVALIWSYVVMVLNFLLTWAALRVLRIAPASLTALLGTGLYWYLPHIVTVLRLLPGGPTWVELILRAGAFALAAWGTLPRGSLLPRAAAAVALVLLVPLNSAAETRASQSSQDSDLTASHIPLLGPQFPTNWHLEGVGTETLGTDTTFYYRVSPDFPGKGAVTMAQMQQQVQVFVGAVQPGFTPPSHCTALTSGTPLPSPACAPVAPGVWRHADYQYVEYFARVGDTVAVIQGVTPAVSESFLRELAVSMRVRTPSYFTGG
ncbi:hypothetical protein [Streptacidiphilus sp. P02-A3a]|uniref:hypothetical protein n=1 Tax=Streptacidiphilus sp. P02-A3a TaxID=2704468 RepID=UPI0015FA3B33|nr:hypothetical protein [Streptacidiphilus sp. P02-A3a]QMU68060.1 hypothetical protein GXP74_07335 [Streptacidiphilus sp. P02-A3a]